MIQDLSQDTQNLFNEVLHQRLLPFVSKELPLVEKMIWDQLPRHLGDKPCCASHELSEQPFRFSAEEPAINRYGVGGDFKPHTDKFALTLNILLTVGTFEGGGTEFWTEPNLGRGAAGQSRPERVTEEPALRILPNTVGVGVLFNGTVKHAGHAVTQGVRHLLVASFSIARPGPPKSRWVNGVKAM